MEEELTLTGLLNETALAFPHRTAVYARGMFDLTHVRLQELVDHAAALLVASGVGVGDFVALAFPNTIEFVILFLAIIRCRATAAPLDPAYTAQEFEFYLSDLEGKLLLTPQEGKQPAQSAASKLNIPHLTARLHSADSKITLSSTDIEPNLNLVSKVVNDPSDVALYLRDSRIPGVPKRMQSTQNELAGEVRSNMGICGKFDSAVMKNPLFHYRHLVYQLLSCLAAGTPVALPGATAAAWFSASRFSADTVARVPYWSKVPSISEQWYARGK